jgi:hypothetical protein
MNGGMYGCRPRYLLRDRQASLLFLLHPAKWRPYGVTLPGLCIDSAVGYYYFIWP